MENLNFNFDKFVDDIEKKEAVDNVRKQKLMNAERAWEARRRLNALYREKFSNRIILRK